MLTALLRRWVEGDEQGFKVPARAELGRLFETRRCRCRACFTYWKHSPRGGAVLTCCPWLPQEAMHAEAHMLVDTSYGSLLVGAAGNLALQWAPGTCTAWHQIHCVVAVQFCCLIMWGLA